MMKRIAYLFLVLVLLVPCFALAETVEKVYDVKAVEFPFSVFVESSAVIWEEPVLGSTRLGHEWKNAELKVIGEYTDEAGRLWYQVEYEKQVGFVPANLVSAREVVDAPVYNSIPTTVPERPYVTPRPCDCGK